MSNAHKNAKQPGATGCFASLVEPSQTQQEYITSSPLCQAELLDSRTVVRLRDAGFETLSQVAEVLASEGEEGLLRRDGIGPRTVDAVKQAVESKTLHPTAPPEPPSLDEIEAELDRLAREKALSLFQDLDAARADLDRIASGAEERVAAAERGVRESETRIEAIDGKAEDAVDRAITLLGDDAQPLVERIIAARDAELLAAQAAWQAAEQRLEAARRACETGVEEAEELRDLLQEELDDLMAKSPVAARAVDEYGQVSAVVAEAQAFLEDGCRSVGTLMHLAEQLSGYARRWPEAARVLAEVEAAAGARYAAQLREKIEALTPSPSFPRQLKALIAEAQEAGVFDQVRDAVEAARERDRRALAEKGREARLYADEIRENRIGVEEGDLVGYCAGRVAAYRAADENQLEVTQAFKWNGGSEKRWLFLPDAVGQVQPRHHVEQRMHLKAVA